MVFLQYRTGWLYYNIHKLCKIICIVHIFFIRYFWWLGNASLRDYLALKPVLLCNGGRRGWPPAPDEVVRHKRQRQWVREGERVKGHTSPPNIDLGLSCHRLFYQQFWLAENYEGEPHGYGRLRGYKEGYKVRCHVIHLLWYLRSQGNDGVKYKRYTASRTLANVECIKSPS